MHRKAEQARGLPAAPDLSAMPDGSRQTRRVPQAAAPAEAAVGGIVRDPIDVRDRAYEPTLAPLAPHLLPDPLILDALRDPAAPWALPRSQGEEGTCGGQALAALIDLQRIAAKVAEPYPVSARMIYECARLKRDAGADDGVSLRDVIKGFYNYGVCRNALWPYEPGGEPGQLSIERARDAKNLSLGAYYRLRPNLNTYHAALHETGALLVSAELHDGWRHDRVRAEGGAIVAPRPGQPRGALGAGAPRLRRPRLHPRGLPRPQLLGPRLGRLDAPRRSRRSPASPSGATTTGPTPSWTAGCSASASAPPRPSSSPSATRASASAPRPRCAPRRCTPSSATSSTSTTATSSPPAPSSPPAAPSRRPGACSRRTPAKPRPYKGVLLTFAGGLTGLRDATDHVARWKRLVRDAGWYPFTVLWCVDYVEQARGVLEGVFADGGKRAGGPGPRLDRVVEELAHGIGRALWRDIGRAAERAARPGGPLHDLARAGAGLAAKRPGFGLRIVAESEGAIALAALLRAMRTRRFAAEAGPFFEMLESVDLVAPPLDAAEFPASPPISTPAGPRRARTGASSCTCPTPATRSASPCRPTGSPTSSSSAAPSPAAPPARRPTPHPPRAQGGRRPGLGRLAPRAAGRARAHRLAAGRRADRPGADQPDPAPLPLRRRRPAQGHPAPAAAAASPVQPTT